MVKFIDIENKIVGILFEIRSGEDESGEKRKLLPGLAHALELCEPPGLQIRSKTSRLGGVIREFGVEKLTCGNVARKTLETVRDSPTPLTPAEAAKRSGQKRKSVFAALKGSWKRGLLTRDEEGRFGATPVLFLFLYATK